MKKNLIALILFLLLFINPSFSLYLLAVSNETGVKIKFKVYLVQNNDNQTDVFYSSPSFISPDTQFSMKLAKDVVCSIFPNKCKPYDFLIKIYSKSPLLTGPSGGAAFATGMLMALFGLPDKEVGITGTINPGGVIGPVGGVDKKVEAALDLEKVIIPLGQKNYRDLITNKTKNLTYPNVYEAGTIFNVLYLVWGVKIKFNLSDLKVPNWYKNTMRDIASSLCSLVNKQINDSIDYYSQASYCFRDLNKVLYNKFLNYDERKLELKYKELKKETKDIEENLKRKMKNINSLNELQLYMIIFKRIDDAKDNLNKIEKLKTKEEIAETLAYVEARLISIKEWSKFLNTIPHNQKIDKNKLKNLCEKNYEFVNYYYTQIYGLTNNLLNDIFFNFFKGIEKNMEKLNYYKEKDPILCIAYAKEIKSSLDYFSAVIYINPELASTFFNNTNRITEFYLKLNKEFPIMAYSYWKYANEIAKKDKDYYSAINYNYLAMNLATMIYEISTNNTQTFQSFEFNNKKENDESIVLYVFLIISTLYYILILRTFFSY
jgi:predicted S18 family serine protease